MVASWQHRKNPPFQDVFLPGNRGFAAFLVCLPQGPHVPRKGWSCWRPVPLWSGKPSGMDIGMVPPAERDSINNIIL